MGCICSNEEEGMTNHVVLNRIPNLNPNVNDSPNHNRNTNHNTRSRRHQQNSSTSHNNLHSSEIQHYNQINIEPYLQARNDPYFNFEEIPDVYSGEGLKRMKGYISTISQEELTKKRVAFWETRVQGNQETWQFLRNICENPDFQLDDIKEFLAASGIVPYAECINVTYDTFGGLYEIPNYCINEPIKYDLPGDHKKKPKELPLKIIIRKGVDLLPITDTNYMTVAKVKHCIREKFPNIKDKKGEIGKILLFFGGKELKDDKELWFYNVTDEAIILLMIRN